MYDPLVMGLNAKAYFVYIGIAFVVIFLAMFIIGTYCLRKMKRQINEKK